MLGHGSAHRAQMPPVVNRSADHEVLHSRRCAVSRAGERKPGDSYAAN
ncbi:hypothetical protein APASM_6142 [Actinosynnema pretiosum subsp. pretiosum]|nr:hypothetical protein APASM_6142 [Actinosynnema pretiosum subsp. pretiosum]